VLVDAEHCLEHGDFRREAVAQMVSRVENIKDEVALRLEPSDFGVARGPILEPSDALGNLARLCGI